MGQSKATALICFLNVLSYTTVIPAAIIADGYLGPFVTICVFSWSVAHRSHIIAVSNEYRRNTTNNLHLAFIFLDFCCYFSPRCRYRCSTVRAWEDSLALLF
jgi:dipeptide/tripeptide permease